MHGQRDYSRSQRSRSCSVSTAAKRLSDIAPIGQALNGEQLVAACRTGPWDLAIVDLLDPGHDALEIVSRLRQECPAMPLIAVSFNLEPGVLQDCLRLGVLGLIASEDLADELAAAIHSALAGERYLSRAVRDTLDDAARASPASKP
jgi:DNA-binding NarL/FixJ family response regulator